MTTQTRLFPPEVNGGAILSPDRLYRYRLWRAWDAQPMCNFVMLNPSTADEADDDPTIRRCIGYAERWGYGGIVVTNLFSYRSTDPRALRTATDPIGPDNDAAIVEAATGCGIVICAWGAHGGFLERSKAVRRLMADAGVTPHCLKQTGSGEPGHPLYLPGRLIPIPMED